MDLAPVVAEFGISAAPEQLPGGSQPTFRAGNVVLKRVKETSLENNQSQELVQWIAAFSQSLDGTDFRFPKAIPTRAGTWITPDGWTAWTVVAGQHSTQEDVPVVIEGILAFHKALHRIEKHPLMEDNQTPWGKADRWCWDEKPDAVHPAVKPLVDQLYDLRRPVETSEPQLIHGDLNPENILMAPHLPPAFLDLSPFWRPVEFALGMYANWIGPRQGDISVLQFFKQIRGFDQMLIRASIRMLLVMSAQGGIDDWDTCSEKRAAELVIQHIQQG